MKITVLGSGSWGTALAKVLADNGENAFLWGIDVEVITEMRDHLTNSKGLPGVQLNPAMNFTTNLAEAVEGAEVIVLAVASQAAREVLGNVRGLIQPESMPIIVNVMKGIETSTLKRMSEIVEEFLPTAEYVALSGPSHAEEVSRGIPTTLVSACKNKDVAELIQDLFSNDNLRIYTNPDVVGVEIGGALKNVIALGAGISDGLGFGDNAKAALMTRGIVEIAKLGKLMGAKPDTFKGLAGIGDLIVTCTSMHSRNRRFGILIGEGKSVEDALKEIGMVVEGYYTIKSAYDLSVKYGVDMPITQELYRVLYEGKEALQSVKNLMLRRQKHEMEEAVETIDLWN